MKDYKISNVDYRSLEHVLFNTKKDEYREVTIISGVLLDNYFCDNFNKGLIINNHRVKPRKHLFAYEQYLNEWSSELDLVLTDDDKKYFKIKRDYLSDYLKDNKKDHFLNKDEKDYNRFILKEAVKELSKK